MRQKYIIKHFVVCLSLLLTISYAAAQTKKAPVKNPPAPAPVAGDSSSQGRFALVIGNNTYKELPLDNPVNDARLVAKSLQTVGFRVTSKENLTLVEMRSALTEFSRQIPPNGTALFYFAGHGVQVSGKNFVLPIDYGDITDPNQFIKTILDLDGIVAAITQKSGLAIVVLDACRNNPTDFALPVAVESGFAPFKQTSAGIYIAYSTAPGTTALDGSNGNSPYSSALARNLRLSPARLEDVFIRTRIEVETATNAQQTPWENGALKTFFYFTPDKLARLTPTATALVQLPVAILKPKTPNGVRSLLNLQFSVPVINSRGTKTALNSKTTGFYLENSNGAGLEMIEIRGGKFGMGSSASDVDYAYQDFKKYSVDDSEDEEKARDTIAAEMPQHTVEVPGFFMSRTEITQAQWQAVMGELPPISDEFRGGNKPVVNISWEDANKFCETLSGATGRNYRLPNEAEWEYAARAGTGTPFGFGDNINPNAANYFAGAPFHDGVRGEIQIGTLAAGHFKTANNFGLLDMQGNVWEWTADYWHDSYDGAPTDGSTWDDAPEENRAYRAVRGGAWDSIANSCRSAYRRKQPGVEYQSSSIGFRVVAN